MHSQVSERFEFDGFRLDLRARTLSYREQDVALRPKSFDVLVHLVRNAGQLVLKDEIIAVVWPDVVATDESLARCMSDIRAALGDADKELIRTVPGRGYQLTAEVTVMPDASGSAPPTIEPRRWQPGYWYVQTGALILIATIAVLATIWPTGSPSGSHNPRIRPSIAVLPFRNSSGDPKMAPFVVGLTSDLNNALARIPEMLVISSSSARRYRNNDVDVRQVAAEMGVDHVLTGTVQRSGDQVRVAVQLTDGRNGSSTWSHRYDRKLADFLRLQDDIVKRVLIGLQIELTDGDTARDFGRGTDNLEAWLLNVEGLAAGFKFTREENVRARELFTAASKLDPHWAVPVSSLAWTYREALRRGWSDSVEADRKTWLELAERCTRMDPRLFSCLIQLGNYHIETGHIEKGIKLRERALQLAPNNLSALAGLAWQLILVGQVKRGLELLQRAKRVSPIHPPWLIATEAYAFQVLGQYDKAINGFRYALAHGNLPDWHARLAAVYAEAGDLEKARAQARLYASKRPNGKVSHLTRILRIQDPVRTQHYAEMLKMAGIPE